MKAVCIHHCSHVYDKQKTISFYEKALWMHIVREMGPEDGSWTNTFMANESDDFQIELTWNRELDREYQNGGPDVHLAFEVDDYEAAKALHKEMGVIVLENNAMDLYFIADPEGNWIEILSKDRKR